jgi:hypothetical protein
MLRIDHALRLGAQYRLEETLFKAQGDYQSALAERGEKLLFVTLRSDEEAVERLKETIANHLDRFAFREAPLPIEWSGPEDH